MEHLALVYISLTIGVFLGVLLMAIVAASHPNELPESRQVRTHARRRSSLEVSEPSWAGGVDSHQSSSVVGIAVPTHTVSGTKERDFA